MFLPTSLVEFGWSWQIFKCKPIKFVLGKKIYLVNKTMIKFSIICCISYNKRVIMNRYQFIKSWRLKVESFGNYAGWSYEQIRCWQNLWALKCFKCECNRKNKNLSFNFVEAILVLSASVKGPKTEAVWNVKPSKFTIICNSLQTEIAQEVEFKCVWFLLLYIRLQSNWQWKS